MQPQEVKVRLESRIDDCEFHVQGEGCNFQVTAVSARFEGLSRLERQQLIYAALGDELASGELHALSMRTYTPAQWAQDPAAALR